MAAMHRRHSWRKKPLTWVARSKAWLGHRWYNLTRWQRILCASIAGVLILGAVTPVVVNFVDSQRYKLDPATLALIGNVNQNLAAKLIYDSDLGGWDFNAGDLPSASNATVASLEAQAGGGGKNDDSLYAASFPSDLKKGITFTDSQTQLSFKMVPQFNVGAGRETDGRLVYPMKHGAKLIYTTKDNGMKEDIVVPKFVDSTLDFTYQLKLPDTLRAKIQSDGSVGIFSADPILFGNVSTGSDMDAAKLQSARESAPKNHLLFALPAPVIKQTDGLSSAASTHFALSGNTLTVVATHMDKAHYPVSVDPSIVVTNTSDFVTGNNEDDIAYGTDQISRGSLTGGTVPSWQTTTSLTTSRELAQTVYYNGYMYEIGGETDCSSGVSGCHTAIAGSGAIRRAQVNTDGTLGTWQDTSTMPGGSTGYAINFQAVVYNSKLYLFGHITVASNYIAAYYANINSDGTLGDWVAVTSLPQSNNAMGMTAYDGYMYLVGGGPGGGSGTYYNTVYYAAINADGTLGSWISTSTLPDSVGMQAAVAYNGYIYSIGGASATGGTNHFVNAVYYAKVKADGSLGSWMTTASFSGPRYGQASYTYNGYMYLAGGYNHNDAQYAQINANGTLAPWTTTASLSSSAGERYVTGIAYNGYLYAMGGRNESTGLTSNVVQYAKIDPPGIASTSTTTTAMGSTIDAAVNCASFMANGYLYCAGGWQGSDYTTQVRYAKINADGTIGTWNTTSALQTPMTGGSGVGAAGYAVSNNRIYLIGGATTVSGVTTNVSSIQYASINTDGTLGTWALNPTAYVGAVSNQPAAAYNGHLYMVGNSGGGASNRIYSASINADGTVGAWTWDGNGTNNFLDGSAYASMVAYNGYLYIVGGYSNPQYFNTVDYAKINADGTLGTWAHTSSLATSRDRFGLIVVNGYMYALGGEIGSSTYSASVEYAPIHSDGTLGAWASSADMSTTARQFGVASWNDTIYVIGGVSTGTYGKSVLMVKTRAGGGGVNNAWTTSGNTLATGLEYHASAVYNGYIYVLGGLTSSSSTNSVEYAKLGDDGSVGSWSTTTPLVNNLSKMGVVAYEGYMYVLGGQVGTSSSTVSGITSSAPIHADGTLGSWTIQSALPQQRASAAVAVHDNYVYVLGGTKSSAVNTVYYTTMSSDGTLGTWQATSTFANARYGEGSVVNGDYIYVLGGVDSSSNYYQDVQYAPINSDGTLGTWARTTDMNYAKAYITPTVLDGFLYIYGGYNGTVANNKVDYAPFAPGGGIGSWTSGTTFTSARYGHQVDVYNGYAYLTGGYGSSTYYNDVQSAPIQAIPRVAHYSKLFDLGGLYTLSGISYGGSLPGGTDSISYRTAGADGVFGSSALASSITGGSAGVCTVGSARYVLVQASLDDSLGATFPDIASSPSSLSSLTVAYTQSHPSPNKRLMHGKYFQDEALQPLDTCAG